MTIVQLRAFLAAYTLGSFTAAANDLGTSQASISELIRRLEEIVGLSLFIRGGRRLIATAAADELRRHAEQSVRSIDNGLEALRSMAALESGVCTFGVLRNAGYYDLSDLVQRFHVLYPRVKVRLIGLNSALVAESIASGELEAGLVVLPVLETGLLIKPLFQDEVLYASATRDPALGPMTMEEMAQSQLVLYDAYAGWTDPTRKQILERAQMRGLSIDPVMEVEHVETAVSLVSTGAADTIVCRTITEGSSFPKNIHLVPFKEPLYDTIALAQRESTYLSPATLKIAELAEKTLLARMQIVQQPA